MATYFFNKLIPGEAAATTEQSKPEELELNIQIVPEGFGSYLDGILPPELAVAAGAFGASMQQVKNITQLEIEKFAQIVANLETTVGLPLVGGTNIPVDATEANAGLALIALGSGPRHSYTFSDFFGSMSGLPYPWVLLQKYITNIQSTTLATIYSNLYAATLGPTLGLDVAVQAQIDLANAEIAIIRTVKPGQSVQLEDLWEKMGTQLGVEQRARVTGLAAVPSPRDTNLNPYPVTIYSFTDLLPKFALQVAPHMAAQTLEAISDLDLVAGQSIVAEMRAERNQVRLNILGVPLDDNISDALPEEDETVLIANGVVDDSIPAYPFDIVPVGTYDPVLEEYLIVNEPTVASTGSVIPDPVAIGVPSVIGGISGPAAITAAVPAAVYTGGPIVPGSLAGSPYTKLVPPALNVLFTSDVLKPSTYPVDAAIEQVINCNCDCWVH